MNKNELLSLAESMLSDINYDISILANASALLADNLSNINWVGFYIYKNDKLLLGPFQGKYACNEIRIGNGVCGTSAKNKETIVVDDVHKFKGHIACDSASNSEIVVPIILNNELYGVLDIDSPLFNRFTNDDKSMLEQFVFILEKYLQNCKQ